MDLAALVDRVAPILVFLISITVVAELADGVGVFRTIARAASRLARGSVPALWLLVVLVAVLCTAVLSLDTTAVLLTPVVLSLAAQLRLDPELFAYTTVWLANTASLLLPVSNLTNLLSVSRLGRSGGSSALAFLGLTWPAAVAAVVVTVVALALVFRRSLRGRFEVAVAEPVEDKVLLVLATVMCALLGPAFLAGVDVTVAATAAALVVVVACLVRRRSLLGWHLLPWKIVLGVSVLFVAVELAHEHGLGELLGLAAGSAGQSWVALLRLSGIGALAANLVDNLPAYLALEPTATGSPFRLAALLIGVNAGPLVTPWASLATILWAARCRSAGVSVSWRRFALRGLVLVPCLLVAATTALWLGRD